MCDPHYVARPDFEIPTGFADYFAKLKTVHGIDLVAAQQAWYVSKAETQLEDMKREFPATPDEAFSSARGCLLRAADLPGPRSKGTSATFRPTTGMR